MKKLASTAVLGIALAMLPEAARARECSANFTQEGDWNTGVTFKSFLEIQGVPREDAVERIAQEMAIVGFQGLTASKDVGIVSGHVASAGTGKQSPINAVARQISPETIRVEVLFQLLGGLRTSPSAVRDELCQILEAALPEEQRAVAAAAAESTRPRLQTTSGSLPLKETIGELRKSGFGPVVMFFLDYQGVQSAIRTQDRQPQVVVTQNGNPQEAFLLVKLDPDAEENRRSLKMGSAGKLLKLAFQGGNQLPPDKDWTISFTVRQDEDNAWILGPEAPLAPGEYGFFEAESGSLLYDFGVDE